MQRTTNTGVISLPSDGLQQESASVSTGFTCPLPFPAGGRVLLGHGSGGKLSAELLQQVFLPALGNPVLDRMEDQAVVSLNGMRLAMTTDSFVVKPLFFKGGDIGSLSVHGTINDLAMGAAKPLWMSVAFILEEGLPFDVLRRVVASMQAAAERTGVQIITGDTKVVEKGSADGMYINTTGIGLVREGISLSASQAKPGDAILVSGMLGDHGIAILAEREGLRFDTEVQSDSAALHELVDTLLAATHEVRCLRDPTRGGLSSTLNEIAGSSRVGMELDEAAMPVREEVRGACEMLGLDPLYVANEGKLVAIVSPDAGERALAALRSHPLGRDARVIGRVTQEHPKMVVMRTAFGTTRIVDMLSGDQLPRIC
ncbi:MAG TPA: hydrogenase expression/formation protein HypE [Candidatus Eisenbacteria bacterium]|nr:hydrogenase expression/formation protein HypE [Candidatus Eisenbacteria bacterium]